MKHIRRKITVSVLGTMLFVFAALLATVNIFIPEYLTSEAQKAILLEDERKDPIPLSEAMDDEKEHFLTSSVRYLEVEEGLTESEHLSKAEYQLRKYCREEKPAADEFHTLKPAAADLFSEYHRSKPMNMRTHIRTFCMWMSEQLCNIRLI